MTNAMDLVLREAKAVAKDAVSEHLAEIIDGLRNGKSAKELIPDVIQGVVDTKKDAKDRAWRTFLQQIGVDMVAAILAVLATSLAGMDFTSKEAWIALAVLLGKTALSVPIAYVMRLKKSPHVVSLSSPEVSLAASQVLDPPVGDAPPITASDRISSEGYSGRG